MNLGHIHALLERLRKDLIGRPKWIEEKQVFEYRNQSREVVAILKLLRAGQGLTSLDVLCRSGLFIDLGASIYPPKQPFVPGGPMSALRQKRTFGLRQEHQGMAQVKPAAGLISGATESRPDWNW